MSRILIVAPFAARLGEQIGALPAGVRITTAESFESASLELAEVEVLIAIPEMLSPSLMKRMPRLEWLQTITAGIDPLMGLDLSGVALTTTSGIHIPQMSELAFLFMLAFARDIRGILARQAAAEWHRAPQRLLAGAHVVIVGVGRIAEGLAQRCRMFDMRVTGVSGAPRELPGFDRIVARDGLIDAARAADYLIVIAPYSPRNHHLISREVIGALPPTAVLINIARGPVVDEAALIDALAAKRIAAAGLDVFEREPLPADHAFWRMPNVIVTPHIGGVSMNLAEQLGPLIAQNIARWFASPRRPLLNQAEPP